MSDLVSAFRWVLLASILIAAGMVADLGVRRSFHLGLATVLAPIEPDTRERALIIAAGSGDVPTVRALLAQGVRPEPETFNAAIVGAYDPIYGRSGCGRHAEVTQLLLDVNPRLRPADNARGNVVRQATRIRGCDEVSQLIGD